MVRVISLKYDITRRIKWFEPYLSNTILLEELNGRVTSFKQNITRRIKWLESYLLNKILLEELNGSSHTFLTRYY